MLKHLLAGLCAALTLGGCGQAPLPHEVSRRVPPESKMSEAGTAKLIRMLNDYYTLKDALIAGNAIEADEAAERLIISTGSLKNMQTADSTTDDNLLPILDSVQTGSRQLAALDDASTEKKRIYFKNVSNAMYSLLKYADLRNAGIYRQYCPMAFNDKGAYWLSSEPVIRNPYFGRKMLECGEVADTLK